VRFFKIFLKLVVAAIVAFAATTGISVEAGLIDPKTFGIFASIFLVAAALLSRRLASKHKVGIFVLLIVAWSAIRAMSPEAARVEDASGKSINIGASHVAHWVEMPKRMDCVDPFVDAKTGESVKYFRVVLPSREIVCYDRPGSIGGEDLRPITKEVAYMISQQKVAPPPAILRTTPPAPPAVAVAAPAPTPTPETIEIADPLAETEPEMVAFIPETVSAQGPASCDSDSTIRDNCDRFSRYSQ
jgi:hypothetical protein